MSSHVDEGFFPNAPSLTKFQVVFFIIAVVLVRGVTHLLFLFARDLGLVSANISKTDEVAIWLPISQVADLLVVNAAVLFFSGRNFLSAYDLSRDTFISGIRLAGLEILRNWKPVCLILVSTFAALEFAHAYLPSLLVEPHYKDLVKSFVSGGIQQPLIALRIGILAPLAEEATFRAFMFVGLRKVFSFRHAAIASSLVFGFAHTYVLHFIFSFAFGLVLCKVVEDTKSIVPGLIFHTVWNCSILGILYFFLPR